MSIVYNRMTKAQLQTVVGLLPEGCCWSGEVHAEPGEATMFMDMFGKRTAPKDKPGRAPRPLKMTERAQEPLPPRKGGRKAEEAAEGE